ncbi:MAG: NAD(P)H-binding protein [Pseudonocardiaceae bacterium]|nr:NAD(P)H-binding protein [Pseudonocardiaceae bacterium]
MKVAVFGATGRTGGEVVTRALAQGHEVTAVVRNPESITNKDVTVAVADVHDRDQVAAAIQGVDAVISTLGGKPRKPTTVYSDGLAKITEGMRATGARRLLCLSSGALDLGPHVPFPQRIVSGLVVRFVFKEGHEDMAKMEAALREVGDLDWTVVRVPGLNTKPATGEYRVAEAPLDKPSMVSRADLADYLVAALDKPDTYHKIMEISN